MTVSKELETMWHVAIVVSVFIVMLVITILCTVIYFEYVHPVYLSLLNTGEGRHFLIMIGSSIFLIFVGIPFILLCIYIAIVGKMEED